MRNALLIALLAAAALFAGSAAARDEGWSFLEHPALSDTEVSVKPEDAVRMARETGRDSCMIYEEHAWQEYIERHPQFRPHANQPGMRDQWLQSALKMDFSPCYYKNLTRDMMVAPEDLDPAGLILYCGNISREPRNSHEARAVRSYLLLLSLAGPNSTHAIETILDLTDWYGAVRLDRRFRHYLLTLQQLAGESSSFRRSLTWFQSRQMLSPGERELVEAAAKRGDLAAILRILPPCAGDPEESRASGGIY